MNYFNAYCGLYWLNNIWNEFSRFSFELNQSLALFNEKIDIQNVSARAKSRWIVVLWRNRKIDCDYRQPSYGSYTRYIAGLEIVRDDIHRFHYLVGWSWRASIKKFHIEKLRLLRLPNKDRDSEQNNQRVNEKEKAGWWAVVGERLTHPHPTYTRRLTVSKTHSNPTRYIPNHTLHKKAS